MGIKLDPIEITPKRNLKTSSWGFDGPALRAGEVAHIVEVLFSDPENPLYTIRKADGTTFPCHRYLLQHCGALDF